MKNLLLIILAAASIIFAQTPEETSPNQKQPSLDTHSGVYFEASIGGKLIDYSHDGKDGWFSSYEEEIVHGDAISAGFKVGWLEKNSVALYGTFDYTWISGSYKYIEHKIVSQNKHDYSILIDANLFYLGAGMLFYPFRNTKSIMRGSYVGGAFGYYTTNGNNRDCDEHVQLKGSGAAFKLEIGKGWHITDSWLLGIGGTLFTGVTNKSSIDSSNPNLPISDIFIRDISTNFGLEIKIIRK